MIYYVKALFWKTELKKIIMYDVFPRKLIPWSIPYSIDPFHPDITERSFYSDLLILRFFLNFPIAIEQLNTVCKLVDSLCSVIILLKLFSMLFPFYGWIIMSNNSAHEIMIPLNRRGRRDNQENEDRLSELPKGVLIHILSFLNIKQAIKTCFLSPRWNSLWKFIPKLILHSSNFPLRSILPFLCQDFDASWYLDSIACSRSSLSW